MNKGEGQAEGRRKEEFGRWEDRKTKREELNERRNKEPLEWAYRSMTKNTSWREQQVVGH